jgi:tetratricopeptide (TPR) repeat protein
MHAAGKKRLAGNYAAAILDYNQAIAADSTNAIPYMLRGTAQMELKAYQLAIDDFTTALRKHIADADSCLLQRGIARIYSGDAYGAVNDFAEATTLNPEFLEAYRWNADLRLAIMDWPGAIREYTAILRLAGSSGPAYFSRAYARTKMKQYQEALDDFVSFVELGFPPPRIYQLTGLLQNYRGDHTRSRLGLTSHIPIDSTLVNAYISSANRHFMAGSRDSACKDLLKAALLGDARSMIIRDYTCR